VHNHLVSVRAFATYPSSRGVDSATVSAWVDGMLAVGAKRSRIYDYLLEHDQNVLQVDVDNMVRAHSASIVGNDDNESPARDAGLLCCGRQGECFVCGRHDEWRDGGDFIGYGTHAQAVQSIQRYSTCRLHPQNQPVRCLQSSRISPRFHQY
jgi:hypothetical protein